MIALSGNKTIIPGWDLYVPTCHPDKITDDKSDDEYDWMRTSFESHVFRDSYEGDQPEMDSAREAEMKEVYELDKMYAEKTLGWSDDEQKENTNQRDTGAISAFPSPMERDDLISSAEALFMGLTPDK